MSNLISYHNILKDRENFRKAGGHDKGNEFNLFDTPSHKYFKILFYFNNGDSTGKTFNIADSGGLLSPTWNMDINEEDWYKYNSAWSYLKMNYEDERADNLVKFVNLLSNISSESPWYFNEISGVDTALERKMVTDRSIKIEEQRQKISIKCLADSFDDRIGTLLDLYRSIVFSWVSKREILPSNLRKFDMGLFIYNSPTLPYHNNGNESSITTDNISGYKSSYKYIEFHNCEIDYTSSKANFSSLNAGTGISPEYTIDIYFDDCYEERYNEFILKSIGDYIINDLNVEGIETNDNQNNDKTIENKRQILNSNTNYYDDVATDYEDSYSKSGIKEETLKSKKLGIKSSFEEYVANENIHNKQLQDTNTSQGINEVGAEWINKQAEYIKNKALMGNIYTLSLTKIKGQYESIQDGNIWGTVNATIEYGTKANNAIKSISKKAKKLGNIYKANTIANNI